jgi:hypothetical protein
MEAIFMSKFEGKVYEEIAERWFKKNGIVVLNYQPAYGIDFFVRLPDGREVWYEVKGKQLIDIHIQTQSLRVQGFKVANVEFEPIEYYLLIIYDNFCDKFRIFNLHKDIINKIRKQRKQSVYIPFYQVFKILKREMGKDILYDINSIDISKRKFSFEG